MRRLSIARSVQLALLGLTLALTTIAGLGVASLYGSRQDYEDRLSEALELQASAARLLAGSVVEEATLRTDASDATRRQARSAFDSAVSDAQAKAGGDTRSQELIAASARAQQALRAQDAPGSTALRARQPVADLAERQQDRIDEARQDARDHSRRALIAILVGGGLALGGALALVAALLAAVRRPLDDLVEASGRLAAGQLGARVDEGGPDELRELGRSFNSMAGDLQLARERIEAERRRLDVTVRSLADGLVVTTAEGEITAVNPRAKELLAGLELPPLADALAGEVLVERDGRTLAVTAAALEDEGGYVWTLRDISERARLERLKSEFVATASHELRSPLTSIKGFIELLSGSEGLDERQKEFVHIVLLSTNRLVDLVNDLLDVARIEAGRVEVTRRPADLGELVTEVADLMRPRIEEKGQTLELDIAEDLPRALADPVRVRQIVTNLLTNAHLYTQEGGELALRVQDGRWGVTIDVSDTGRGMTDEEVEQVFDRFFRGGDGTGAPGTGLGLAIVKSLVDLHGGTIDVTSTFGKGTTFTVTLPHAPGLADDAPAARHALAGKRVLVLDDEPEIARLIAERLEPYGVDSTIVHTGEDALKALRSGHFDAVTVDILMPGMSGFDVLRELRTDPHLAGVPAVVVSVFSGREALSGEWVVSKPIDPEELADSLGAAVLAGRVRVIVVGREEVRDRLTATLDGLGIEHEWTTTPEEAARRCADRYFEVALVDAGLERSRETVANLRLRGRRLRRSVVVFAAGDEQEGFARLDAEPVALADAGATVLGLLETEPPAHMSG
jgi:signal transduction histidine kinase/DNA-binding response OmpR family regulator